MEKTSAVADLASQRQTIRLQVRKLRQALSQQQQLQAACALAQQMLQLPELQQATHIALYLSNDAELSTEALISALWQAGKQLYLPVLHPFAPGYLIFQRYQPTTTMRLNRFQIPEPVLNCAELMPVAQLDLICTPLVAFDPQGNRLGMGGGFYDRTLSQLDNASPHLSTLTATKPVLIGLAHQCQQVAQIPVEAWDIPLPLIVTPTQIFRQNLNSRLNDSN